MADILHSLRERDAAKRPADDHVEPQPDATTAKRSLSPRGTAARRALEKRLAPESLGKPESEELASPEESHAPKSFAPKPRLKSDAPKSQVKSESQEEPDAPKSQVKFESDAPKSQVKSQVNVPPRYCTCRGRHARRLLRAVIQRGESDAPKSLGKSESQEEPDAPERTLPSGFKVKLKSPVSAIPEAPKRASDEHPFQKLAAKAKAIRDGTYGD